MDMDKFVTIVSGLPRSGTSMMMRMLEVGGMPVVTDRLREADIDNPLGYYEFEPVKKVKEDQTWLEEAQGKAVKMVYSLLYHLPTNYRYRVLFMRRALDEVLASQRKMLERLGKKDDKITDAQMAQLFRSQLQKFETWIKGQPSFALLEVNYNQMVQDPTDQVQKINAFLGGQLNTDAMSKVVDTSLYRNRAEPKG
jgi:hypothetical protein